MKRFTLLSPALDLVYLFVAILTAPWWMKKARGGWGERFGRTEPLPPTDPARPRLLLHAVSVGEVNLTRPFIDALGDGVEVVLSVTTDTGIARARALYADRLRVVRYPLDASWSVRRFLDAIAPDAVALVELELWPNFLDACARRRIPVAVVNGRLSARSFKGYRRLRPFLRRYFERLAHAGVQDETYRERFCAMGVPDTRCEIVGTMKWDSVVVGSVVPGADQIGAALGIDPSRPLIVAGSTAPEEHTLLREAMPAGAQLLCAPRRPEWFDDAARDLAPCARRTQPLSGDGAQDRFVLDTIGELRAAYALADLVVVGRSFGDLHGSDPMEPAALGKPVLIGPAHDDFATTVAALRDGGGLRIASREGLASEIGALLEDDATRASMAAAARRIVLEHQGPSRRYAEIVCNLLGHRVDEKPGEVCRVGA